MLHKSNDHDISWILDLKQKIQQSQIKAAIQVNSALKKIYWDLGNIAERNFDNTDGFSFFFKAEQRLT